MTAANTDAHRTRKTPIAHRSFFALTILSLASGAARAQTQPQTETSAVVLDRAQVIARARASSAELALAHARVDVVRASRAGTRAWSRDNPTLSLAGGPRLLNNGDWVPDLIVGVSVPIEFAGIAGLRPRVVDASVRLAEAEADALASELVYDALELWVRAGGALRMTELASEQRAIHEQSLRVATVRASHGATGGGEVALATLALAQSQASERSSRAEALSLLAALKARLAMGADADVTLSGALDVAPLPSIESLVEALRAHPRVAVALARATVAEREWQALSRTIWPAPRVSLAGGRENEYYARVGVDVGLPVFQRGEGALAVARAQGSLADAERRSVLMSQEVALRQAFARASALEAAGGAHEESLRAADTVTRMATRSFELGERELGVTLIAMREANLARRAQAEWSQSRALARLAVDRATGGVR
jgi:cobalt-zinc-cadmium efflux system outer membrane protein